jgi:hypothetical protein
MLYKYFAQANMGFVMAFKFISFFVFVFFSHNYLFAQCFAYAGLGQF